MSRDRVGRRFGVYFLGGANQLFSLFQVLPAGMSK